MTEKLTEFRPRVTSRDRIEQHAARGLTPDEIVAAVGEPLSVVDVVLNRMDAIHRPAAVGRPKGATS